jgi:enoyl-CoA hydratase/carnithine racemase
MSGQRGREDEGRVETHCAGLGGHVLVIRLNRPHKRNAINQTLSDGLEAAVDELERTTELRAGVLVGSGGTFSAGTDLRSPAPPRTDRGGEYGFIRRQRTKPVVAGIEGWALGGGLELALACDLVVAASSARLGLPEVARGLVANSGALFRAARALPRNIAAELLLTGKPIYAERAYAVGLVNEVCPPGEAEATALGLAELISGNGPVAVQATLAALRAADDDDAGWAATAEAVAKVKQSQDRAEGIAAFFAGRPPQWTGR